MLLYLHFGQFAAYYQEMGNYRGSPVPVDVNVSGLVVAESRHGPDFSMPRQRHSFHEIILLLQGRLVAEVGDPEELISLDAGDVLILPEDTLHLLHDHRSSTVMVIAFSRMYLDQCAHREALWGQLLARCEQRIIRRGARQERYAPWRDLVALSNMPPTAEPVVRAVEQQTAFTALLLQLYQYLDQPEPADAFQRVSYFAARLPGQAHEVWSLDRAAAACNLSRRRFSELFRQLTGDTFVAHLQELRIYHAQQLMRNGTYSIAGAAYASGFEDVAHFYRVFRRFVGNTPGQWLQVSSGARGNAGDTKRGL